MTVIDDAPPFPGDDMQIVIDAPVDVLPIDARECPAPPATCNLFTCPGSNACYYECGTTGGSKASWTGARDACVNGSLGCIVTISSQAEQDCVVQQVNPMFMNQQTVWFGFHQTSKSMEPAGNWAWQCGTSTYLQPAWGSFEPTNDNNNEDCAAFTDGGGWFDANCTSTMRYVCELP